ncbi:hypothetical protein FVEG_08637 [Fusarium verticillioides 7600]|uniref:Uncharacterized protein n=1 Tax=Gibberella moniliformis (strain M3125 / FGSC 7600) TaxID=334819 RepID=W7MXC2_GIBM7|nr:hypothetical protein FVEG_08637 [Fusarium verticillioides 7600]EWG49012.1 hypothetical protein FVEG_08637 [Fusarium verticillioides 7600]
MFRSDDVSIDIMMPDGPVTQYCLRKARKPMTRQRPMIYIVEKHIAKAYLTARCNVLDGWSVAMSSGHRYSPRLWQGGNLIVSSGTQNSHNRSMLLCGVEKLCQLVRYITRKCSANRTMSRYGSLWRSMSLWAYYQQLPRPYDPDQRQKSPVPSSERVHQA